MKKYTRFLLTLCLMLLTTFMPPMAFACASVCAITVKQKTDTNHQLMADMSLSSCRHEVAMSATQSNQPHTETDTPCLASAICHLTVGIYSASLPIHFLTTYPVIIAHIPTLIPQLTVSLPDKPPRV